MKNKSLKQMKRVLLGIFAVGIVGLAVANVNLAFNSESEVNITLASVFSFSQSENGNDGNCTTYGVYTNDDQCIQMVDYGCFPGNNTWCVIGTVFKDCYGRIDEFIVMLFC